MNEMYYIETNLYRAQENGTWRRWHSHVHNSGRIALDYERDIA